MGAGVAHAGGVTASDGPSSVLASVRPVLVPCQPTLCSQCEVQLEGEGPWSLADLSSGSGGGSSVAGSSNGSSIAEEDDVSILFTPGHTAGCLSLLYRPDRALFTGDSLAYSARLNRLTIFRNCERGSRVCSAAVLQGGSAACTS